MRKYKEYIGIIIIAAGVLMLFTVFMTGMTNANAILLTALAFVLCGIVVHVVISKKNSRY